LSGVRLTRRIDFSASHRLWRPEWTEARNRAAFGRASSPHGHGHNYRLDVTLQGEVDEETGMLVDLKWLKEILENEITSRFDHRNLNDDTPYFSSVPPTAENLVRVIFDILDPVIAGNRLDRVRLWPHTELCVEFRR